LHNPQFIPHGAMSSGVNLFAATIRY